LQATILAFANAKTQPSDKTELTYWETPAGLPLALRGWFWPGDVDGQEFAYPKDVADRLSAANNNAVVPIDDRTEVSQNKSEPAPVNSEVTGRSSTTESTATTVAESTPRNTADTAAAVPAAQSAVQSDVNNRRSEELLAQNNAPPARSPDPVAEARPATPTTVAQVNAPPSNSISELPQTASATPWVLAIGVSALLIAVAIRYRRITI